MGIKEDNKRNFFRIRFDLPICSKVSIYTIDNTEVNSGYTYACIKDIGPGGLCFHSQLDFPVKVKMTLNFNMIFINKPIDIKGSIVRKRRISDNKWEYGVEFNLSYRMRLKYMRLFNEVAIQIYKNKNYLINSFCNSKECKCVKIKAS